ncbi:MULTISPECIES: hypothetical protein [unclassified Aeromicrobium]|uniref:hypothetical protein n=1 Tax=unclassified Aeromicrobium TaxID=2633570 RepID=UPI00396B27A6
MISTFFEFVADRVLDKFTRHPDAKAVRSAYAHALSRAPELRVASFGDALVAAGVELDVDIEVHLQQCLEDGVPTRRACAVLE